MEKLLGVLSEKAPAKADALAKHGREVQHGRLSVGLKIHLINGGVGQMAPLIEDASLEDGNAYQKKDASWCPVLPPLGSANAAIDLLLAIEQYNSARGSAMKVFNNPNIHLQVCSPGWLNPFYSALLAIMFYLGSDTLRRYALSDLRTTFSNPRTHSPRAQRLVLYEAKFGVFENNFPWWGESHGDLTIHPEFPFPAGRTDILVGPGSQIDIKNINLIATLLVHAQYGGFWRKLGLRFVHEVKAMLKKHDLFHLLEAPWVYTENDPHSANDDVFFAALQELVAYAFNESAQVKIPPTNTIERLLRNRWRFIPKKASNDLLIEVRSTLMSYHKELVDTARSIQQGRELP